jgi:histone acetyltransferase MYST1
MSAPFSRGDIVQWQPRSQNAQVIAIEGGSAYLHFLRQDARLDRWVAVSECVFVSSDQPPTVHTKHDPDDPPTSLPVPRNINSIQIGRFTTRCWYSSPYPCSLTARRHLYICDHCLLPFASRASYLAHRHLPSGRRPPGIEIYRDGPLSLFEVSPEDDRLFCQLCSLLGHLFYETMRDDHFYCIEKFHFYVLCECDDRGAHVVGFFSRVARHPSFNLLSRIMVLPPYQRRGFGVLMIAIAYEIARRKGVVGGPERPLSDLAALAFHRYWVYAVANALTEESDVRQISEATAIAANDVKVALVELGLLAAPREELNEHALSAFLAQEEDDRRTVRIPLNKDNLIWFPKSSPS